MQRLSAPAETTANPTIYHSPGFRKPCSSPISSADYISIGSSAQWRHLSIAEGLIRLLPRNAAMKKHATSHLSLSFYKAISVIPKHTNSATPVVASVRHVLPTIELIPSRAKSNWSRWPCVDSVTQLTRRSWTKPFSASLCGF